MRTFKIIAAGLLVGLATPHPVVAGPNPAKGQPVANLSVHGGTMP